MFGWILLGIVLLICGICAGFSALRGLSKSGIRSLTVLLSAVAALVTCWIMKGSLPGPEEFLLTIESNLGTIGDTFGPDVLATMEQALEYAAISPTLVEFAVQLVGALLFPLLCVLFFLLYSFLTWIIYLVVTLILRRPLKSFNENRSHSRLWAALCGLAQGLIIVGILFIPVSGYLSVADAAIDASVEEEILDANDPAISDVQEIVSECDEAPTLTVYRVLGGNLMTSSLMSMEVADMDVKVEEEIGAVMVLGGQVIDLADTPLENYGAEEAVVLRAIGESFDDSKLLTPIAGEILYAASDAWMNGEDFLGQSKPDLGESNDLFEPFVDALLEIVHEDAPTATLLQNDVKTLTEMAAIMADSGVIAHLNNTNELLTVMSGDGVVKDLTKVLGTNDSMKRLIPEITNLGVRVIGQVLSIPMDTDAVYEEFMDDVAGALNELGSSADTAQMAELSDRLGTAFDQAGIAVDDEILDFYTTSMVHDLVDNNPNGEVTADDVKAFFLLYAENVTEVSTENTVSRPSYDMLSEKRPAVEEIDDEAEDIFAGTVYANMTEEQRSAAAATVLANICTELSRLDAASDGFTEQAQSIVVNAFTELLGEDHAALETVKAVTITRPVSAEAIRNTASMKSPETMKETTVVVTVENLLVDTLAAAGNITADTIDAEADAIAAIFNTAGSLVDTLQNSGSSLDITTVTNSLGTILDSLKSTGSFGEEKTATLFTAVLQSKTVRDTVGLDMKTATEMANQATAGGGNYSQTLGTVAGSIGIMEKLQNNEKITDEELVEFMKNLTPQSAGMFRVFVTGDRLETYGLPEKYSGTTADLISSTFTYMSREDLTDYDKEAKALNLVLQMALAAKDSDSKKLFSSSEDADDGRLPTAKETVTSILDSHALQYAFVDVLTDGKQVTCFDPFGLSEKISHGSQEYIDCQNAIYEYRDAHPETNDLVFEAMAALVGVEIDLD